MSKTDEQVVEVRKGNFKIDIRTQEVNKSGIRNVDVCVADEAVRDFPKDKAQCFFHGFDFDNLAAKWTSQNAIEISFNCGRVDDFRNSAVIYVKGSIPEEFYASLRDACNTDTTAQGSRSAKVEARGSRAKPE